ncbi:hypothetical protein LEWO105114_05335 [Legionella worsleiensis]|nr:Uncharacterised protein [Legionella worsleiensis]
MLEAGKIFKVMTELVEDGVLKLIISLNYFVDDKAVIWYT